MAPFLESSRGTFEQAIMFDGAYKRVMMGDRREGVLRIRARRFRLEEGHENSMVDRRVCDPETCRYMARSFKNRALIYHREPDASLHTCDDEFVPVGHVMETKAGATLIRYWVLHLVQPREDWRQNFYNYPTEWFSSRQDFERLTEGRTKYVERKNMMAQHLFVICESEADLVNAQICFGGGTEFHGFNLEHFFV